jgi:PAB-dependent poly(A)-specific ribonuclease subunit 2
MGPSCVAAGWHVFNDFAVSGLSEAEALHFNTAWKIPCVLYYARPGAAARHPLAPPGHTHPIPADVLCDDAPYIARLPRRPSTAPRTFVPLAADQVPGAGYHVAIDAEFVALHMEEAAIRSDGTKSTLKPSQLCLARVSALHGEAPRFGQAFLDDYIATTEPVADYLTQYSGIHPGDLDPGVSTKHLVTLKATYLKLRCLADRGVVFVGHGLKKDFGIINMVVPKAQIVDTVDLFYMPRQRRISLRFLAWFLLNIDVQGGNHDSIEDARTALYLWDKYRQLVRDGELDKTLKDLYEAGRRYKWKAPHWVS